GKLYELLVLKGLSAEAADSRRAALAVSPVLVRSGAPRVRSQLSGLLTPEQPRDERIAILSALFETPTAAWSEALSSALAHQLERPEEQVVVVTLSLMVSKAQELK